jgi:hypothetical protein
MSALFLLITPQQRLNPTATTNRHSASQSINDQISPPSEHSNSTLVVQNTRVETNVFTGNSSDQPYLVYCDTLEYFLLPIVKHFTLVHLLDKTKRNKTNVNLPPWNATVLLIMDEQKCGDHPYVKESVQRRKDSAFLDPSKHDDTLSGEWRDGIYWPKNIGHKFMRAIKDRPALMSVRSEVFWRANYNSGSDVDFVWDRHTENPSEESFVIHYVQGAWAAYHREYNGAKGVLGPEASNAIFEGKTPHPSKPKDNEELQYDKFCSLLVRSDPNNLVHMFIRKIHYDVDAIVRHMFFKQLSEYKPCSRIIKCDGSPYDSYKCFGGHKFHITMENSQLNGYISEKVFNGALGGNVPIYFGAPDIGSYINEKSIVHCQINRTVIEEMRSFYPRVKKPRPFLFNRPSFKTHMYPTEEEIVGWANSYLRKELEPCVQKVIELDNNDTLFRQVLREPLVINHEILDGMYPLRGIKLVYDALRKWETILA